MIRRNGLRPPALDLAADSGDLVLTVEPLGYGEAGVGFLGLGGERLQTSGGRRVLATTRAGPRTSETGASAWIPR